MMMTDNTTSNIENYTKKGQNIVGSVFIDFAKADLVVHDFSSQPMTDHSHHHH